MGNPTPNAFVSAYKNYFVKKTTDSKKWDVLNRGSRDKVGIIQLLPDNKGGESWCFCSVKFVFTQVELLDIAAAVKTIEKRADAPSIFKP